MKLRRHCFGLGKQPGREAQRLAEEAGEGVFQGSKESPVSSVSCAFKILRKQRRENREQKQGGLGGRGVNKRTRREERVSGKSEGRDWKSWKNRGRRRGKVDRRVRKKARFALWVKRSRSK